MTDLEHLNTWIGREEVSSETLTPALADRFAATLDLQSGFKDGDRAPTLIHLCLNQPALPASELGRDGHPKLGGFLPPVPLPRRMWAGGAFTFLDDIRVGETVTRRSRISNIQMKQGRTGPLCFVTVQHEITSGNRPVLSERQDIVYREDTAKPPAAPPAAPEGSHQRQVDITPTLLFRYSALTFNGHRIHYDLPYARQVEGYAGLVVHGPLQATQLVHYASELRGRCPGTFRFRSLSTLFDSDDMALHAAEEGDGLKLWTARTGGPVAMEAVAEW